MLPQKYHSSINRDLEFSNLTIDSREVNPNDLFFALADKAEMRDRHIKVALNAGAACVLYEQNLKTEIDDQRLLPVDNVRKVLGDAASHFFDYPSRKLKIIGITGTNGKTSVCHLAAQALTLLGKKVAVLGTAGNGVWPELKASELTTLETIALHQQLHQFVQLGVELVFMEVSSHGLDQQRAAGVEFEVAAFTNLSRDHLDYHNNMDDYAQQKRKLFDLPIKKNVILNIDEQIVSKWLADWPKNILFKTYSMFSNDTDFLMTVDTGQCLPQKFTLTVQGECLQVSTTLIGRFNLYNILTVIAILAEIGFNLSTVMTVVPKLKPIKGRMQLIHKSARPKVLIDFCHTPDALEKALCASREICHGKLVCVFGCGGDRDKGKRPQMGRIAEKNADKLIISNDNPRTEDPQAIAEDILQGVQNQEHVQTVLDRREAISLAIQQADENDIVLIAGKGHEEYQIIGKEKQPFSDEQVVLEIL